MSAIEVYLSLVDVPPMHLPLELVVSEALACEVVHAELIDHVDRFVYVSYTPAEQPDPDVVICLEPVPYDKGYNRAVRAFQIARYRGRAFPRWEDWDLAVLKAAQRLMAPLERLGAGDGERALVGEWVMGVLRERRTV
jgi:hypothetical protein